MVEPTPGPPPIFGVTVEQYAGVNAAWDRGYRGYYAWLVNAAGRR